MKALKWIGICLVSLFFLTAGISKIVDPVEFARAILRYQLVGSQLSWITALWLPWLEVLCAVGLCLSRWRQAAACLLTGLLAFFEIVLFSALLRGLDIECGCLGTNVSSSLSFAIIRNGVLITVLILLIVFDNSKGEKSLA